MGPCGGGPADNGCYLVSEDRGIPESWNGHEDILEEVGLKLDALNGFEEGVGFHT